MSNANREPSTSEDIVLVDGYDNELAKCESYKGLPIHALEGLHAHIGQMAQAFFPKNARVLDLASGSGALSLRLADLDWDVTSCDIVSENYRLHDRLAFRKVNLNSDFSDALEGPYDAVCAIEIIEHLENPRHFLREIKKLLAPGGKLILSTPNIQSPRSIEGLIHKGVFALFGDRHYQTSGHITPISQWQLRTMLDETTFRGIQFTGYSKQRSLSISTRTLRTALIRFLSRRSGAETGELLVVRAIAD